MSNNDSTRADLDDETDQKGFGEVTREVSQVFHSADPNATPNSPSFFDQTGIHENHFELNASVQIFNVENLPMQFGNYRLLKLLGEGGAGMVFLAEAKSENPERKEPISVAVKLIRPAMMNSEQATLRFVKEARLQSEVINSYVPHVIEYGCHEGLYFIVSEFVEGTPLNQLTDRLKTMPVKLSLRIISDVLAALSAMHEAGVIHRDVKPGNVIADQFKIAKLTDFGLARHIDQSESMAMTRQQAVLGTPLYMAPEQQSESRSVDERADIYSIGVTLYEMLTGKLPVEGESALELAEKHRIERPHPPKSVRTQISQAVSDVVMKALEKSPDMRYQDAAEMQGDIQRLLEDRPTSIRLYPETPDTNDPGIKRYEFSWTLAATTKDLWPLVADTDRFNRAIGLPAPTYSYEHKSTRRKIFAEAKFNGMKVRWREHPFQWIQGRAMSVLREFEEGPFEWVTSTVKLSPLIDGKTHLEHLFQVKPRGLMGKLVTPFQFNVMTKRSLDKVYRRLERIANDRSCGFACDVSFAKPPKLTSDQQNRLNKRIDKLASSVGSAAIAEEFGQLLRVVADPFAVRIRPIPLATKLDCSVEESMRLCLASVEIGLLNLAWDVICPVCRTAATDVTSLQKIASHSKCQVCDIEFEVDFAKSVELIFGVHPEIRSVQRKTYCIGGPFHAPHVLAQNRLLSQQSVDVGADLNTGVYSVCGPQFDRQPEIVVSDKALATRVEIAIGEKWDTRDQHSPRMMPGAACVHIKNEFESEILVRLEQRSDSEDAVTAAVASQNELFQQLFPHEFERANQLVEVARVYLLGIRYGGADGLADQIGDIKVQDLWKELQTALGVDAKMCQLVEESYAMTVVSFDRLEDLLKALQRVRYLDEGGFDLPLNECSYAINCGSVMVGAKNQRRATFGKTVRKNQRLLNFLEPGVFATTDEVWQSIKQQEDVYEVKAIADGLVTFTLTQ